MCYQHNSVRAIVAFHKMAKHSKKRILQSASSKDFIMDYNTFEKIYDKIRNNGAPDNDLISNYWIKKSYQCPLRQFNMVYEQDGTLPE